jgi:hypothetical protein
MTTATVKSKIGQKRVMDMTKAEVETYFAEATTQAQKEIHSKGLPYTIGDKTGIYDVYPDGKKINRAKNW